MESIMHMAIGIAALAGFALAFSIFHHKRREKPMVCPLNGNCHAVMQSSYSKFLRIPLEYWGMLYYFLIFAAYLLFFFSPESYSGEIAAGVLILSACAFIFSLYLILLQGFVLKEWCTWCLISEMISTIIFVLVYLSANTHLLDSLRLLMNAS